MGCGDHWPRCHGYWFPPLERMDLIIEVTHRYVAAALTLAVLSLLFVAWRQRESPAIGGRGGVLRPAVAAALLVVAAALLGAVTVKLELHAAAVVIHLGLAMFLIAALALAAVRSSSLSSRATTATSPRTLRGSTVAVVMAFFAVLMGGATANMAGAAVSCVGFPHCRSVSLGGAALFVQVSHRILAFLVLFHLLGMVLALRKRGEPAATNLWAKLAFVTALAQILVAAAMVETGLPLHLRVLHQALGTLVWLVVFVFAAVTRQPARP